jgi:hypothetical protein
MWAIGKEKLFHLLDEGLYNLDANDFFGFSPIPQKIIRLQAFGELCLC